MSHSASPQCPQLTGGCAEHNRPWASYRTIGAGRVRTPEETAESRSRVRGFWHRCDYPVRTIAATYLTFRSLPWLVRSPVIRFRLNCRHPSGIYLPAMIALVLDARENLIAVHRTYLTLDGHKADVDPVKASLGSFAGGAIRLGRLAPHICVGEGIESSASAGRLLNLPPWSAISCGNLAHRMVLPPEVRTVTIAVDPDDAGRWAAKAAARRWRAEGRTVLFAVPGREGEDFNDLLRRRLRQ
jgi:hypothetical protein